MPTNPKRMYDMYENLFKFPKIKSKCVTQPYLSMYYGRKGLEEDKPLCIQS
jgi:hypothetical protein